jgi:hypothetical protein
MMLSKGTKKTGLVVICATLKGRLYREERIGFSVLTELG